ncbi:MAG: Nif3-like dinuclear metal center hexameric protein, partial [Elusimicrobiales bacterium]
NNMSIIKLFGCDKTKRFANYHGNKIGFIGYFKKPVSFEKIVKTVREEINPKPLILPFGKRDITSIAVISGSGSSFLKEAIKNKVDVFITGEAQEYVFETAKESYINFVAAAHYRTEVYGIKNLCKLVREKFKIETFFLDTNNPL